MKVRPKTDFTIDASHELALFIYYNGKSNPNEMDYPQNSSSNGSNKNSSKNNSSSTGCDCKNPANKTNNRYQNDMGNFCKAKCEHEQEHEQKIDQGQTELDFSKKASVELLTMSKASYFCSSQNHLNNKCAVFPNAVSRNHCVSETLCILYSIL